MRGEIRVPPGIREAGRRHRRIPQGAWVWRVRKHVPSIGRSILDKQADQGWGSRVIDRLAADLRAAFPEMKGFSPRNLKYMRAFAAAWPEHEIVQHTVAQLSWRQNIALLEKLRSLGDRFWYAARTLEHGWSRNILALQIDCAGPPSARQGADQFPYHAAAARLRHGSAGLQGPLDQCLSAASLMYQFRARASSTPRSRR